METLLRLKPWYLFMLTFGLIIVAMCVVTLLTIKGTIDVLLESKIITVFALVGLNFQNAWVYMIATTFYKKLPRTVVAKTNINAFKVCFWYIVIFQVALLLLSRMNMEQGLISLLLLALFAPCSTYVLYLAAKILQSAELQRPLTFGDVSGDFFAFIFYPVGVWFLQPRINRLFENDLVKVGPKTLDQGMK
jgi:hypothetical protein